MKGQKKKKKIKGGKQKKPGHRPNGLNNEAMAHPWGGRKPLAWVSPLPPHEL